MPDILVKKTRAEPGEASLEVIIPPDNVKAAEDRATKFYQQRARLPGFRQGKVPAAVVRKKFADDIRQETLRELVQESWRVAQKQEELKPIADPQREERYRTYRQDGSGGSLRATYYSVLDRDSQEPFALLHRAI